MIPIVQVDAFTERAFGGNPAAVVLDAQGLSGAQMQAIATEMRVAGTAKGWQSPGRTPTLRPSL